MCVMKILRVEDVANDGNNEFYGVSIVFDYMIMHDTWVDHDTDRVVIKNSIKLLKRKYLLNKVLIRLKNNTI